MYVVATTERSKTILFKGTTPDEAEQMIHFLNARSAQFSKDELICHAGDSVSCMGLVLSGSVHIESDDIQGNRTLLSRNLLSVMAQKNPGLSQRIFHTTSKTIRGRLLSYLSAQAARTGSYEVTVPFNRQQLADYLSVDRSAMSNELNKMQKDGLLSVHKSTFL